MGTTIKGNARNRRHPWKKEGFIGITPVFIEMPNTNIGNDGGVAYSQIVMIAGGILVYLTKIDFA
jgi:hypothetical protein